MVIAQDGKPLAYYNRKLSSVQRNYTTTGQELLSIVETLKDLRNIILGQKIIAYIDHKNLVHESEVKSFQCIMWWRLLLEDYGPKIKYIKDRKNIIANTLSRLLKQGDIVDGVYGVRPFVSVESDMSPVNF